MNINELAPFIKVLVLIGMLIGIGIIVFDNFGTEVKVSTNIVNETIAIASGTGTTTNDDVTAVTYFGNSTWSCTPPDTACVNFTTGGVITSNATFVDASYDISYTYDADSTGTTTMASMVTAISPIATTWLPLIVTVSVLAIILGLVISSFMTKRK